MLNLALTLKKDILYGRCCAYHHFEKIKIMSNFIFKFATYIIIAYYATFFIKKITIFPIFSLSKLNFLDL